MQQAAGHLGGLVKTGVAHGVGQAGIGVAADEGIACHFVQLLDVGAHERGTQSAVQANGQGLGVAHAVPKRGHRLTAQNAARSVGHGAADDEGQALAAGFKEFFDGKQRGLGVERVKNRLDQQHIAAAFHQGLNLLVIGSAQFFKRDVAGTGVVHVGADAGRLGRGTQSADHIARLIGGREFVASSAGDFCRLQVHLAGQVLHVVVGLGHGGRAEGVGLDQVGPGGQIAFVDVTDHIGAGQAQQLVVALDVFGEILEPITPVVGLGQFEALDHGAHGTVKDGDAVLEDLGQRLGAGVSGGLHGLYCKSLGFSPF